MTAHGNALEKRRVGFYSSDTAPFGLNPRNVDYWLSLKRIGEMSHAQGPAFLSSKRIIGLQHELLIVCIESTW